MASSKSKNTRIRRPVPPPRPPDPDYIDDEDTPETIVSQEQEDTIRSIVGKLGGGGELSIKVYKVLPGGGDQYWYTADSSEIDEEKIRNVNLGVGGKFHVKIFVGDELVKVHPISIADAPGVGSGSAGVPAAGTDPVLLLILQRMQALEAAAVRQAPAEPFDRMADAMVKLNSIRGDSAPKEMPIDTLLKCIELGKTLGGGGTSDDSWLGVVKEIFKEIGPALAPLAMAAMRSAQPATAIAAGSASVPGATDMQQEEEKIAAQLREGIVFLKKKCMQGADPEVYLSLILDSAGEEEFAKLIHIATSQDFAVFARLDPDIEKPAYIKFFKQIYDGIRSEFSGDDSVVPDSGGAGGDASNTTGNVRIIKTGGK